MSKEYNILFLGSIPIDTKFIEICETKSIDDFCSRYNQLKISKMFLDLVNKFD